VTGFLVTGAMVDFISEQLLQIQCRITFTFNKDDPVLKHFMGTSTFSKKTGLQQLHCCEKYGASIEKVEDDSHKPEQDPTFTFSVDSHKLCLSVSSVYLTSHGLGGHVVVVVVVVVDVVVVGSSVVVGFSVVVVGSSVVVVGFSVVVVVVVVGSSVVVVVVGSSVVVVGFSVVVVDSSVVVVSSGISVVVVVGISVVVVVGISVVVDSSVVVVSSGISVVVGSTVVVVFSVVVVEATSVVVFLGGGVGKVKVFFSVVVSVNGFNVVVAVVVVKFVLTVDFGPDGTSHNPQHAPSVAFTYV